MLAARAAFLYLFAFLRFFVAITESHLRCLGYQVSEKFLVTTLRRPNPQPKHDRSDLITTCISASVKIEDSCSIHGAQVKLCIRNVGQPYRSHDLVCSEYRYTALSTPRHMRFQNCGEAVVCTLGCIRDCRYLSIRIFRAPTDWTTTSEQKKLFLCINEQLPVRHDMCRIDSPARYMYGTTGTCQE